MRFADPADCLKTRPKTVALLGLGVSRSAFEDHVCCGPNGPEDFDEIWTVNYGHWIWRHDKAWVMDDLRGQAQRLPHYGRSLARHDVPIITSTVYPEFPMSVACPTKDIIEHLGDDWLNSTVAYALGYAMMTGVKDLYLYGCDFHYPNQTRAEEGGQNAAYLLGMARHFGMSYHLPPETTLLGAYHAKPVGEKMCRPLYGYAKQPFIPEEEPSRAADAH